MPANIGAAGAIHRVGCFAGMPAPTPIGARQQKTPPGQPAGFFALLLPDIHR